MKKNRLILFYAIDVAVFVALAVFLMASKALSIKRSLLYFVFNAAIFFVTALILHRIKKSRFLLGNFLSGLLFIGIGVFVIFINLLNLVIHVSDGGLDFDSLYALLFIVPLILGAGSVKEKSKPLEEVLAKDGEDAPNDSAAWGMFRSWMAPRQEESGQDGSSGDEVQNS